MATKVHKVFVSYHHIPSDQPYRNEFERLFSDSNQIFVSKSVQIGDIDPNLKPETIRQKIRDEYYVHRKIKYNLMRKRFVELYKNRLQDVLDFPYVVVSKMIKGDNNQPLYYLIVAGREQVVEIIGKDIFDVKTEQITLKLS